VAAHRKRKGSAANDAASQTHANDGGNARLSAAAARVAARYAVAPSYSDLFDGFDGAERGKDIRATTVELEPAAKQIPLLDLGTASSASSSLETPQASAPVEQARAAMVEAAPVSRQNWEPDWSFGDDLVLPERHPLSEALKRESHRAGGAVDAPAAEIAPAAELRISDTVPTIMTGIEKERQASWSRVAANSYARAGSYSEAPDSFVVDAQAIPGNLIEFPMELVASRKVRPRRAEGLYGAVIEGEPQLSIFEVDPASVSTHVDAVEQHTEAGTWSRPEWADMKLEAPKPQEPAAVPVVRAAEHGVPAAERGVDAQPAKAVELQAAPMNLRILAAVVDFGMVSIGFLMVALLVAVKAAVLPTLREAEIDGGLVFAAIAFAYLAISYTLARATPGMKYALISLRTFDGQTPTREQRCRRLGGLVLSMLPVGLGAVWAIFDEEHLSWHDRLSGTYLRRV
jgi:uncharacterized RDD family membrane protein YckC